MTKLSNALESIMDYIFSDKFMHTNEQLLANTLHHNHKDTGFSYEEFLESVTSFITFEEVAEATTDTEFTFFAFEDIVAVIGHKEVRYTDTIDIFGVEVDYADLSPEYTFKVSFNDYNYKLIDKQNNVMQTITLPNFNAWKSIVCLG